MTNSNWGASPAEWDHFSATLGLTEHLLPVVSRPDAQVSDRSRIGTLGKTPTKYNPEGQVVGIANWTSAITTAARVGVWSRQADYGICLQTRLVRALDIDVGDPTLSAAIESFINDWLLMDLPVRRRPNSGKCLMAISLMGELGKRTIEVQGGVIEFLATGQQFVAAGTHPSGVRYEWDGGLPAEFPTLTIDEFESLWQGLVEHFGTGHVGQSRGGVRVLGEHVEIEDPVAEFLDAQGLVLGHDRVGNALVRCPWSDAHSGGTLGDSSTLWFKAGTNSHSSGHFHCLHAHCAGRTDGEFFDAIGYEAAPEVFDAVPADEVDLIGGMGGAGGSGALPGSAGGNGAAAETPPVLARHRGMALATIENVIASVRKPFFSGMRVRYDTFKDAVMYTLPGSNQYFNFGDDDYTRLREHYAVVRRFKPLSKDMVRDAVLMVAREDRFDSAIEWLNQQFWDGVPRCEQFLSTYFGVEDSPYARAVSRYMWSALAGRTLSPGVKVDMIPILVGGQGVRKSSAVRAMVVADELFAELQFDAKEDDLSRKIRGVQIAELAELTGLRTKELEPIKAWITKTHESWVPKYQEFSTKFPRRCLFVGTTNEEEFLADLTGNRRMLPVRVGVLIDTDGITRDMLQLWAEAAEMFLVNGVEYRAAETLAKLEHAQYMVTDAWESTVQAWLVAPDPVTEVVPETLDFIRPIDVLTGALNLTPKEINKGNEMRISKTLHALGYRSERIWDRGNKKQVRVYLRNGVEKQALLALPNGPAAGL